jgi:uncharacterized protein (DUF924 family)
VSTQPIAALDPEEILAFWFGDAPFDPAAAEQRDAMWFGSSADTDAAVRERFTGAIAAAAAGELEAWRAHPRGALALVIALDQFPRNAWRGTARAFAHDAQALAVARTAVAAGHFARLAPIEQAFLILPFQHCESLDTQRESVRLSERIADEAPANWRPLLTDYLRYAVDHLALIERFGRFPHRNAALGRTPTAEETTYLGGGGATFGQGSR